MTVEKTIITYEDVEIIREAWEIKYDDGWEEPSWKTIAKCDTLEEAIAMAKEKGYKFTDWELNFSSNYEPFENRKVRNNINYVYDSYYTPIYHFIHYYYF